MLTILKEAMNVGLKLCSNICHSDIKLPTFVINNCSLRHFYKFDEKRARTPRWVISFTSKLQVKKKIERRVEPPDTFLEENPISTKLC
jgi:hypothetical protein